MAQKKKDFKTSNVTHIFPRGSILSNKKITNKSQLSDQIHAFPRYSPFLTRTDPPEKLPALYSPLVELYMSLLKPRSKNQLLPISRIYTQNSLNSYKVLINPQNCNSSGSKIANYGALLEIYIHTHTHTHFL